MSVRIVIVPSKGTPIHEMMAKADQVTLRMALCAWSVCAYLVCCDTELVPARFSVYSKIPAGWLHWQAWLLAGILVFALRDVFTDLRCVECGTSENLLLARRLLARKLLCVACRDQEAAAQAQSQESVEPEYADLFEALK
jgi:hypothetical protein